MQERAPLTARASTKIAAITFAVLTVISLFVLLSLPKTYVAVTRVEVITKTTAVNAPQSGRDPYFIQSEFEKIKSSVVLITAYRELLRNPQFKNVARTPAQDDTIASRALLAGLEVRQSRNTSLFEIRYVDRDPQSAALVANTIARAYAAEAKERGSGEVRIIDLAQPPARPASPNVPLLLTIATALNLVLAVLAGFFASNLFR